jgi:cytosine deaminase
MAIVLSLHGMAAADGEVDRTVPPAVCEVKGYDRRMGPLLLRGGRIDGARLDLAMRDGRIERIGRDLPAAGYEVLDVPDRLVLPGFVETHIHPDKAFIADRTEGLRAGGPTAQTLVAELKKAFTVEDVYRRARRVIELAVRHGCTAMRAHVEIDALVELRAVEALRRLQADVAGILDLRLVAFAQEGIFHDAVTRDLLREALKAGLATLGGCPYMDADQRAHIDWFFDTAEAFGVPLDFHADSADDPAMLTSDYIAEQTIARGMQGRVSVGHLCMLDVLEPAHRARVVERLREAQIHVVSLPATELHVKGRADARRTWRGITRIAELRATGVNVSISTNNVVNPFTPYGHPDLLRQALITAMAAHLGNLDQLAWLPELITTNPARALGLADYGLAEGRRADLVVLDAPDAAQAITEQAEKLYVMKGGRVVARSTRRSELAPGLAG